MRNPIQQLRRGHLGNAFPRRAASKATGLPIERLEPRTMLSAAPPVSTNWTSGPISNSNFAAQLPILLPNGTVMIHSNGGQSGSPLWELLTPNSSGSYVNGTLSSIASMNVSRLYFGSCILPDGNVFVVGGEYSSGGQDNSSAEIYDPSQNTWTMATSCPVPFGDGCVEALNNGTVLCGPSETSLTYIYNPAGGPGGSWTQTGTKLYYDENDEESWVKLGNGDVLTYDIDSSSFNHMGQAQFYNPATNTWNDASNGTLPILSTQDELGPALLLPDGRAFFSGDNGLTAFYNPSTNSWTQGPTIPNELLTADAPGAILPNGDILLAVAPGDPLYSSPTTIDDLNPVTDVWTTNIGPGPAYSDAYERPSYQCTMLVLPTGQLMLTDEDSLIAIYNPEGAPQAAWQPTISNIAANNDGTFTTDGTFALPGTQLNFTLTGTQLNGLDEGSGYGDDNQNASNYPLVQLTNNQTGNVFYARTYNWSTTQVATGSTPETTAFALPPGMPAGTYSLTVVANGIASNPVTFVQNSNIGNTYTLVETSPNSGLDHVLYNGVVKYTSPISAIMQTALNFFGVNDILVIDGINGNPVPSSGLTIDGAGPSSDNILAIVGSGAGNTITVQSTSIDFGNGPIDYSNMNKVYIVPMGDNVTVNSGTVNLPAQTGIQALQFGNLTIAAGASVVTLTAASRSNMTLLQLNSLSISSGGTLNLGGNEMIINYGAGSDPISTIKGYLTSGYNNGAWTGIGIDSSAAAANSAYALGYADGADGVVAGLASGEIEVLYTLYGDANLDGIVNSVDFAILSNNFNKQVSGWDQGDFNYDGVDNGADFTLLAANFGKSA
jgi:hypothetical protein